jgi:hypothetical protein
MTAQITAILLFGHSVLGYSWRDLALVTKGWELHFREKRRHNHLLDRQQEAALPRSGFTCEFNLRRHGVRESRTLTRRASKPDEAC